MTFVHSIQISLGVRAHRPPHPFGEWDSIELSSSVHRARGNSMWNFLFLPPPRWCPADRPAVPHCRDSTEQLDKKKSDYKMSTTAPMASVTLVRANEMSLPTDGVNRHAARKMCLNSYACGSQSQNSEIGWRPYPTLTLAKLTMAIRMTRFRFRWRTSLVHSVRVTVVLFLAAALRLNRACF